MRRRAAARIILSTSMGRHLGKDTTCKPPPRRSMRGAMRRPSKPPSGSAGTSTATSSAAASSTCARSSCPTGSRSIDELEFLSADQRRFLGQVQGRTYANMFGLVERFIGAKMLEVSRDHCARRPDRARGDRPLHRRGAQAPGAVPPRRAPRRRRHAGGLPVRRRGERRRRLRARQVHLGRARADLPHRAVLAGPLPREHRARPRGSRSCSRTSSCSTGRRSRSTR